MLQGEFFRKNGAVKKSHSIPSFCRDAVAFWPHYSLMHIQSFFLSLMVIWGMTVVSDSPQFSALVAVSAPPEQKGTAITLVTCIGFSITIISIQFIYFLFDFIDEYTLIFLAAGPLSGLSALRKYLPALKTGR